LIATARKIHPHPNPLQPEEGEAFTLTLTLSPQGRGRLRMWPPEEREIMEAVCYRLASQ